MKLRTLVMAFLTIAIHVLLLLTAYTLPLQAVSERAPFDTSDYSGTFLGNSVTK